MAFAWSDKSWKTLDEFKTYLAAQPVPSWLMGVTFHHSASPDRSQWRGAEHMKNLGFYYEHQVRNPDGSIGWPSGPHLFLAGDTAYNGIFQGTPVAIPGTHAGPCNGSLKTRGRLGIEIVGNYTVEAGWPKATQELVYGVIGAVNEWAKLPIKETWAHRECMPGHTDCPGKHIDPDAVRAELFRRREGVMPALYTRIIGVGQSVTRDQFWRSIERNMPKGADGGALISAAEASYLYDFAVDNAIDAAAVLGIWAHEQGLPYGNTALGKISRNPFNMRAPRDDQRWVVKHPGTGDPFYAYESWKIGLEYGMLHLKNFYAAYKHLYSLDEIIPVFAPKSDGNDPVSYIHAVKQVMAYIASQ